MDMGKIKHIKQLFPNATGRLVDFFVNNIDMDYSIYEIHKETHISTRTLFRLLRHLQERGIIENSRIVGKVTKMWKLKWTRSSVAMIRLEDALVMGK